MIDSFVPAAVSIVIIQPAFYASHKLPHYFTLKLTASTESRRPTSFSSIAFFFTHKLR